MLAHSVRRLCVLCCVVLCWFSLISHLFSFDSRLISVLFWSSRMVTVCIDHATDWMQRRAIQTDRHRPKQAHTLKPKCIFPSFNSSLPNNCFQPNFRSLFSLNAVALYFQVCVRAQYSAREFFLSLEFDLAKLKHSGWKIAQNGHNSFLMDKMHSSHRYILPMHGARCIAFGSVDFCEMCKYLTFLCSEKC